MIINRELKQINIKLKNPIIPKNILIILFGIYIEIYILFVNLKCNQNYKIILK